MAIRDSIDFCIELEIYGKTIESDAKSTINLILGDNYSLVMEFLFVEDIRERLKNGVFNHFSYIFFTKNINKVVQELARFALSLENFVTWLEEESVWLVPFPKADMSMSLS